MALVESDTPPLARMGLRLNIGGLIKCRKFLLGILHPDKVPATHKEAATRATQELLHMFAEFGNPSTRLVREFRSSAFLYPEEQKFLEAKADFNGEPRPAPRSAAPPPMRPTQPSSSINTGARGFEVRSEKVNIKSIERFMNMTASRLLCEGGITLFEALSFMRRRADKSGLVPVLVREAEHAPGCKGRRFTGCHGMKDLPEAFVRERDELGVPWSLCGTSPFAFSKLFKYICRDGLELTDLDGENHYYNQLLANFEVRAPVREYVEQREQKLEEGMVTYNCTREEIKKLFLRIGFLGSLNTWLAERELQRVPGPFTDFVENLSDAVAVVAGHIVTKRPEILEYYKDRRNPRASCLMAVYMDFERRFLDSLEVFSFIREPISKHLSKHLSKHDDNYDKLI